MCFPVPCKEEWKPFRIFRQQETLCPAAQAVSPQFIPVISTQEPLFLQEGDDGLLVTGTAGKAYEQGDGEFAAYSGQFEQMVADGVFPREAVFVMQKITSLWPAQGRHFPGFLPGWLKTSVDSGPKPGRKKPFFPFFLRFPAYRSKNSGNGQKSDMDFKSFSRLESHPAKRFFSMM